MSTVPFTRQLGYQSGVQLNPVKDNSERFVGGNADQIFATMGRFSRGRIDRAFRVNSGNMQRLLGAPVAPTVNRLNETLVHIYDAFKNGAYEAVVSRLSVADAELSLMVAKNATGSTATWAVEETPTAGYLLSVKHLECINEGVKIGINADRVLSEDLDATATVNVPLTGATPLTIGGVTATDGMRVKLTAQTSTAENGTYSVGISGGNYTLTSAAAEVAIASSMVTLRIQDLDGNSLYDDFYGSLDPLAKDEFNKSIYLPSVISELTDAVEVVVATGASVLPTSNFYGLDSESKPKFVSADLVYFTEGGTGYTSTDVDRAISQLKYSDSSFGYLTAGASRAPLVISKLIALGKDINKQVIWDVPGDLSPAAAITFYNQLNIDTHYSQAYWAPLRSIDPLNGGKDILGTSGANVGMRCRRNALTDANGVPPKNYAVAGKEWPLVRTGIVQVYTPTEQELSDLAKARINPVVFERYNNTSSYVFLDSLTGAKTEADRKLINVAEMSTQADDWVSAAAKGYLQLPMSESLKRTTDFLDALFQGLEAAKWLVPSDELDGSAYVATVTPNAQRPKDRLDINYGLSFDGTNRVTYIQQTISK